MARRFGSVRTIIRRWKHSLAACFGGSAVLMGQVLTATPAREKLAKGALTHAEGLA